MGVSRTYMVAEAYQNLGAHELDTLAGGGVTEVLRTGKPRVEGGASCGPCRRKGITSGRGSEGPYAVPSRRPSWC